MQWRITAAFCVGRYGDRCEYALLLATDDGRCAASAAVDVWWTRPLACASRAFDPAVTVLHCSDGRAAEWLAAAEHEYSIAELLLGKAAA